MYMSVTIIFGKWCKIAIKLHANIASFAISHCIQKWSAASGPDFYAISKMVHYISVPKKLRELLSKM